MSKAEQLTGDTIARNLEGRTQDDSLADVARDLYSAQQHRPTKFQSDLDIVNAKLHEEGILRDFQIVGVDGEDLITRAADGHVEVFNSADLDDHHARLSADYGTTIGGRETTVNADGSGEVTVKKGDSLWRLSSDVLKSQGNEDPTENDIANFVLKLEQLNGKDAVAMIHPGDVLKFPPAITAENNEQFEVDDLTEDHNDAMAKLKDNVGAAALALTTLTWDIMGNHNISLDDINSKLNDPNLQNPTLRTGLEFMRDHFDEMKDIAVPPLGRGGAIWIGGIQQYYKDAVNAAGVDFLRAEGSVY